MQADFPQSNKNSIADKFYVITLMRRGKDNPDMPAANVHFKNYYIYCFDDLEKYEGEIIEICNVMRMRKEIIRKYIQRGLQKQVSFYTETKTYGLLTWMMLNQLVRK